MAAQVRAEHDLPSLRIAFGDGGRTMVRFWLVRGEDEPHLVAECGASELGPLDFRDAEPATDDQFSLPSDVLYQLSRAVPRLGASASPPDNGLWLELVSPRGYLHLVPWERLLSPLGRPLVRLPNYTVRPTAHSEDLAIALCASSSLASPDLPAKVARLARMWISHSGRRTTVHVFADAWAHGPLTDLVADLDGATLHDPAGWEQVARARSVVSHPWLEWVGATLGSRAVEAVHMVGYGYLAGGRGAVVLMPTPTSRVGEHGTFVGGAQLAQFVAGRGAWAFVVSGLADNYSGAGLREVADALALNSPGISVAHDLELDPDVAQLTQVVELVFGGRPAVTSPLPGIACWAHPKFVAYPEENLITSSGHSVMVREATQQVLAGADTPASVASGTRYLESLQATWTGLQPDSIDHDAVTALQRVSDLVERRAAQWWETGA